MNRIPREPVDKAEAEGQPTRALLPFEAATFEALIQEARGNMRREPKTVDERREVIERSRFISDCALIFKGYQSTVESVEERVGYEIPNLAHYLKVIRLENLDIMDQIKSEPNFGADEEAQESLKKQAAKAEQIAFLIDLTTRKRREAAKVTPIDAVEPIEQIDDNEYYLRGDRGVDVQVKTIEKLRDIINGVRGVYEGRLPADRVPLAEGKSREELKSKIEFFEYAKELLDTYRPEAGEDVNDWEEVTTDRFREELIDGLSDDQVTKINLKIAAARYLTRMVIDVDLGKGSY